MATCFVLDQKVTNELIKGVDPLGEIQQLLQLVEGGWTADYSCAVYCAVTTVRARDGA